MDIKDLEGKKLSDLRVIAIAAGIEKAETLKKSEITIYHVSARNVIQMSN